MKKDWSPEKYYSAVLLYCTVSIVLTIHYAREHDPYHMIVSACSATMPLVIEAYNRILPIRRTWCLDAMMLGFIFLSYPVGSCVDLFAKISWFDMFCHMLSGTMVSLLCLILYYLLKPSHRIEKKEAWLTVTFVFFGSMAVAGLWEISEFCLAPLFHRDVQHVRKTGVGDTMMDMIVCLIGTLFALPSVFRLCRKGHGGWLSTPVEVFMEKNGIALAE